MLSIIRASFSRPRTVMVLLFTILFAGAGLYLTIPKESSPDIAIPFIYVSATHDGISPEDAERLIVKPLEKHLKTIDGVKEITAIASQGHASVTLEFAAGFDADAALDDVRDGVDKAKADLPDATDEPSIHEINLSEFPIIVLNVFGTAAESVLIKTAEKLQDAIEALPTVLEAELSGKRSEMVEVIIDPVLMEHYQLSLEEVGSLIARNNQLVAAGTMTEGSAKFPIKVPGVIDDLEKLLNVGIKVINGNVIKLTDVASVRRVYQEPTDLAQLQGQPSLSLQVKKRSGTNVIETVEAVKAIVAAAEPQLPEGVQLRLTGDESKEIRDMLGDLQNNVISGILLVMIVVIGALGIRPGLLVGLAIPTSFLLGIMVLGGMGLSINIVVLFSLILALGLLVDGAIVVVEMAYKHLQEGEQPRKAFLRASTRMAWPITASTMTTLAAFFPLLGWPGIMGEFMRFMPITLISVLSASLVVALVFVPNMGALIFRKPIASNEEKTEQGSSAYRGLLQRLLPRSGLVVIGAGAFMIGAYAIFGASGNGLEFFPEVEPQRLAVEVRSPGDFSINEKYRMVRQVENELLQIEGVDNVFTRVADRFDNNSAGTIGVMQLELLDWDARRPAAEIMDEIRGLVAPIVGLDVTIEKAEDGPVEGKPINLQLLALTPEELNEATELVLARMHEIGGFTEIVDSRPPPGIEWQLNVDRAEAARYGVDIATVGQNIQLLTQGIKLGEYRPDDLDEELDIRARLPRESRDIESLDQLLVSTASGQMSLGYFVERNVAPRVSTIDRADASRVVTVESEVAPGLLPDQQLKVLAESLQKSPLIYENGQPVVIRFKGENEDLQESMVFLSKAFVFAVVLMAAILLTQFNSFYQSFVVMSAVVFSTGGVMLGLALAGKPFGVVMSGIGVIALAGVVVNNNIVLIDAYNELRAKGMSLFEAVVESGAQRFRPVLLTTATTVLGLTPMVLQMNVDLVNRAVSFGAPSTQYWSQLATALAGGLLFATALTLLVTPCMLVLGERLRALLGMRNAFQESAELT